MERQSVRQPDEVVAMQLGSQTEIVRPRREKVSLIADKEAVS
jgi:hypothetical protein